MDYQSLLNKEQYEAVLHTDGPLLILAGAGSGKTRVLTYRVAYLISEKGVNPWNILAITFTNKAAGEMRSRVDQLVDFGADGVWISTFHSMCVRILRRHIDCMGYNNNFTIYDTDDSKALMKDVCKRLEIDTKIYKEKMILGAISAAKNDMVTPRDYKEIAGDDFAHQQIAEAYRVYQADLKKNNAVDFDDLLLLTVQLFNRKPEILESYQERFRYIMVDEYQDTNRVQFELVRLLASKYRNLCVVGDDDQSIYKFRGADIENILSFERHYPDAKVVKLEQNYRSTKTILEVANHVIANNEHRKKKRLWSDLDEGEKVQMLQFENAYEEAEYVIGDLRRKVDRSERSYGDFAILYRTNAQSRIFEEKLLLSNTPYQIVGGVNFYARKEIKDLLSYLKTIDNGLDDLAARRIINIPKRGIGNATIARVTEYSQHLEISFFEAACRCEKIPGIGRSLSKLQDFVKFMQVLRSKKDVLRVSELFEEILDATGYVRELEAEHTEEANGRIENIDELFNKIVAYEESAEEPTLSGFLQEVALVADLDGLQDEQDHVVLMTLHSAKGLEFPVVYLTGMEEGVFPSYMSLISEEVSDLEEERRLCYVGITRAREELFFTTSKMRMQRGETQYNPPSRFLKEIPLQFAYNNVQLKSPKPEPPKLHPDFQKAKKVFHANAYAREQPSIHKADGLSYAVGDTVKHVKFGRGIVQSISEGGRDYEVVVDFEKCGVKRMFASFAKLQLAD